MRNAARPYSAARGFRCCGSRETRILRSYQIVICQVQVFLTSQQRAEARSDGCTVPRPALLSSRDQNVIFLLVVAVIVRPSPLACRHLEPMSDLVLSPSLFINRELSWLDFNQRVLHEAFDERNPLLERLKFLAIFSTNLDEFYMVRVAGLRRQLAANVTATGADGMTPQEQLDKIRLRVDEQLAMSQRCLHQELLPALAQNGVGLLAVKDLDRDERTALDARFDST